MPIDRRTLMTAAAGTAAGALAGGASAATKRTGSPALTHHVFFWLKRSGSAEDCAALIAGLRELAAIEVIRALYIGTPAPTEQRDVIDASYDVSELMLFDNAADQQTYQDHPLHQAFIQRCGHLWQRVVVYDTVAA